MEEEDEYRLWLIHQRTDPVNLTAQDRNNLQEFLDSFTYYGHGIESDPDTFVFAKPCKFATKKKKCDRTPSVNINGKIITRLHNAAFLLHYKRYPKTGFVISHPCGCHASRCAEPSHMEVVPQSQNAERIKCHNFIETWERQQRGILPQEQRRGTIFYHLCPHWPQCYKQFGKDKL